MKKAPASFFFFFFYYYFFCLAGLLFSFGPSFVLVPRDKRRSRIIPLPTFGKKEISLAKAREKTRNSRPPSGLPELAALYSARYELMRSKSRGKRGQQRKKEKKVRQELRELFASSGGKRCLSLQFALH